MAHGWFVAVQRVLLDLVERVAHFKFRPEIKLWIRYAFVSALRFRFVLGIPSEIKLCCGELGSTQVPVVTLLVRTFRASLNNKQLQECDDCLTEKSLAFFLTVYKHYDAKYIIKVDDDVYLNPSRLLRAAPQWSSMQADYVGCMKSNDVISNPSNKWCVCS